LRRNRKDYKKKTNTEREKETKKKRVNYSNFSEDRKEGDYASHPLKARYTVLKTPILKNPKHAGTRREKKTMV